jgi:hypothetical protein
MTAARW